MQPLFKGGTYEEDMEIAEVNKGFVGLQFMAHRIFNYFDASHKHVATSFIRDIYLCCLFWFLAGLLQIHKEDF